MSRSIFLHEIIDIVGQGAWPYMEHTISCSGEEANGQEGKRRKFHGGGLLQSKPSIPPSGCPVPKNDERHLSQCRMSLANSTSSGILLCASLIPFRLPP